MQASDTDTDLCSALYYKGREASDIADVEFSGQHLLNRLRVSETTLCRRSFGQFSVAGLAPNLNLLSIRCDSRVVARIPIESPAVSVFPDTDPALRRIGERLAAKISDTSEAAAAISPRSVGDVPSETNPIKVDSISWHAVVLINSAWRSWALRKSRSQTGLHISKMFCKVFSLIVL